MRIRKGRNKGVDKYCLIYKYSSLYETELFFYYLPSLPFICISIMKFYNSILISQNVEVSLLRVNYYREPMSDDYDDADDDEPHMYGRVFVYLALIWKGRVDK